MASKKVQQVYNAKDQTELKEFYEEWAAKYDGDMHEHYAWLAPEYTVKFFDRFLQTDDKILDAGCGTGFVGENLAKHGYHNLTGIDFSHEMLKQATAKKCYQALSIMDMSQSLEFADETFDALISVGVFTHGHVGPAAVDELVRVTKKGGYLALPLRPDVYSNNGFKNKFDELIKQQVWQLAAESPEFAPMPNGEPEVRGKVWIFQRH